MDRTFIDMLIAAIPILTSKKSKHLELFVSEVINSQFNGRTLLSNIFKITYIFMMSQYRY
jgi:hypothetical protein